MAANGVPSNRESFNTVIGGLCREGKAVAAAALLKKMPEVPRPDGKKGVAPSSETLIMLLEALVEKHVFGPAMEVCEECLRNKWVPPFQAVKGLNVGLARGRKVKHARELGLAMKKTAKGDAKAKWDKVEAAVFQLALAGSKA